SQSCNERSRTNGAYFLHASQELNISFRSCSAQLPRADAQNSYHCWMLWQPRKLGADASLGQGGGQTFHFSPRNAAGAESTPLFASKPRSAGLRNAKVTNTTSVQKCEPRIRTGPLVIPMYWSSFDATLVR